MEEVNGRLGSRTAAEKRSFLEGYMTGYAQATQHLAASYAVQYQAIAASMNGDSEEVEVEEVEEEVEGLNEWEMAELEEMAEERGRVEQEDDGKAEYDGFEDPNIALIMGTDG